LLIQQNVDGSNFFNRSWAEFKVGFNDSRGNYWLGNDQLHQLTQKGRYRLRFDLKQNTGPWYYAEYATFTVQNETYNYRLQVSGYSGNIGYDALSYQNNMMFTTYDRDNDLSTSFNCAAGNGGGFWYNQCASCSVNALRGKGDSFSWYRSAGSYLLQLSRMWLACQ